MDALYAIRPLRENTELGGWEKECGPVASLRESGVKDRLLLSVKSLVGGHFAVSGVS